MKTPNRLLQRFFDVRPGEHVRLWAMFLYLLFVLFAYYIVKPVSRAMFLTRFDIDKLPSLYILIAIFGGIFAYLYSRVAAKVSLNAAVTWAMSLSVVTLLIMWWLIRLRFAWMAYVLNIWVSLFSVILVSQGWLVASNLFNSREAKRLYPILDVGMVLGAALGGEFTRQAVALIGTNNLLLASAVMVVLAYVASRVASRTHRSDIEHSRAGSDEETDFSFAQMIRDIAKIRHVRIIVGMMVAMYLVDTLVEYQFQAMARAHYRGDQLTAFFGQFYGLWLNGLEFVFQLFLTGTVVRLFGVGATLQVSPVAVGLSSVAIVGAPSVLTTSGVRLIEASTRYTLTKTGMELLYMPLPLALRNRVKAFIDICVDRLSRGLGGVLLIIVTAGWLHLGVRGIALMVIVLSAVWVLYSEIARKEYANSILRRFAARRLDLSSLKLAVSDRATIRMLEKAARGESSRQAVYALSLLSEAPDYDLKPLLSDLAASPLAEVEEYVYEQAADMRYEGLLDTAVTRLNRARPQKQLIRYLLTVSPSRESIAAEFLKSDQPALVEASLDALRSDTELGTKLIDVASIDRLADSSDPQWRIVAAKAIGVRGDERPEPLRRLLRDQELPVRRAALEAAGTLRSRAFLYDLVDALGQPQLRQDVIRVMSAYGAKITGSLSDILNDHETSVQIRGNIPRVLQNIPEQSSVDALLRATGDPDLTVRTAALKALNRLRISAPDLKFDDAFVVSRLMNEAQSYYEMNAALAAFRELPSETKPALRLLARTLDSRVDLTLSRLFYLLGLRYPPEPMHSAYVALSNPDRHDNTAALEFLDNLLDHNMKRVLLPLFDAPQNVLDHGEALFGIHKPTPEDAIRAQMQSGEPWLVACSTAAAAEAGVA